MSRISHGASPSVSRGLVDGFEHRGVTQRANCQACGGQLVFDTGTFGESIEMCSNIRCTNHLPHHPIADDALIGPDSYDRRTARRAEKRASKPRRSRANW